MSVKDRIDDAGILWRQGRKEGAWVLTLIAAAATSRKRFPKARTDREAFTSFIRDVTGTLIRGTPSDSTPNPRIIFASKPLEDVIYEHVRCHLIHEGGVSDRVAFSESRIVEGKLTATLAVGSPNVIPDFWVLHLMKAVREAPENELEFSPDV